MGGLTPEAFLTVNMFIVRHLVRLYAASDDDLTEAIVLGEVAHHNLSGYLARVQATRGATATTSHIPDRSDYLPTNPYSIAQATGIPRQTDRRKAEALAARGWLMRQRHDLVVSPVPLEHFREFHQEMAKDLLSTLNAVIRLTRR